MRQLILNDFHTLPSEGHNGVNRMLQNVIEKQNLVDPLETDLEGNRYILTLQDDLSKFVVCYTLQNKESATATKAFVYNFVLKFGIPSTIFTDHGKEFMYETFSENCKLLNICKLNSTAYHNETLGALENSHKSL